MAQARRGNGNADNSAPIRDLGAVYFAIRGNGYIPLNGPACDHHSLAGKFHGGFSAPDEIIGRGEVCIDMKAAIAFRYVDDRRILPTN